MTIEENIKLKYKVLFQRWKDCSNSDYEQLDEINAKMEILDELARENEINLLEE